MSVTRRMVVVGGAAAAIPLLTGATTSLDFGVQRRDALLIAGSEEFQPYAAKLLETYLKTRPALDAVLEGGGTTPGLIALKRGAIDLAMTSRELTPLEDEKLTRSYLVARDAIALIVHPSNPIASLTKAQAQALFQGDKRDWADVGGAAGPVRLYRRKADAATQKALDRLVMDQHDLAPDALAQASGAAMRDKVAADPSAFGFLSLHDVTPAVKTLAINHVPISRATILTGRYPFSRSFFFVAHGAPKPAVDAFLEFAESAAGRASFEAQGLIAVR